MSGKNFRQREEKKFDPLTKTGELTLGNTGLTYGNINSILFDNLQTSIRIMEVQQVALQNQLN
jgi:hypothetical protein